MTEACVQKKRGTYLFCDTDSLAIVASKRGGTLRIPGSQGVRILSWVEVRDIVDKFAALNPYDRTIVKNSILNLVDANYRESDSTKPQRQLYGYSIAAKRYALYRNIGARDIKIIDPKAHGIGFLYPPKDSRKDWDDAIPQWIYEMWDYIVRGVSKTKAKAALLDRYSANDAPHDHYVQRFRDARRMENRSPVQFLAPTHDRPHIRIRIPQTRQ